MKVSYAVLSTFLITVLLHQFILNSIRRVEADLITRTVRNNIVLGNMSEAVRSLSLYRSQSNSFVKILVNNLESIIPVDDRYNDVEEKNFVLYSDYRAGVFYDLEENVKLAEVVFIFNRFEYSWIAFSFWLTIVFIFVLFHFRSEKNYRIEKKKQTEIARVSAVARTTQMLAHDVRKPFSMIKALISMINDAEPAESKKIANEGIPSIVSAIKSVEGMIQDVMEVGSEGVLCVEPVQSQQFILDNLKAIFQFRESLDISIESKIEDDLLFKIDSLKFSRVIQNIVSNAIEHMDNKGKIWIEISAPESNFSSFTIGNSDTYIHPDDLENLFDAFFTKGKKGGTGLGLAITKKIIESHGGTVLCKSSKENGTEFIFSVPALLSSAKLKKISIPNHSDHFRSKSSLQNSDESIPDELNNSINDKIKRRKFSTIVLDDETIYVNSIQSIVNRMNIDNKVTSFHDVDDMLNQFDPESDLVILDVDLGDSNQNGFDVSRKLRSSGYRGKICIHSNRGRLEYQPKAIEAGADFFLPKPMSKSDLLVLLSQCLDHSTENSPSRKVLLFEDESIYQRQWRRIFSPGELVIHESLTDFNVKLIQSYDYVICDYYLKRGETGIEVARILREAGFEKPIFLNSNVDSLPEDEAKLFDLIIDKDANEAFTQISEFLTR